MFKAPASQRSSTRTTRRISRLVVVLAATGVAIAAWIVIVPLLGVDLVVAPPGTLPQPIDLLAVLLASLIGGLAGWAALAVLGRISRHGRAIWTVIAVTALLASLTGPLTSAVNGATVVSLIVMHILVGAVLIFGLRYTSPQPVEGGDTA